MRVAFSGTHRTGKTTLVQALADALPSYAVVDEPYRVLEDDGHEFADPPSVEDYERQLRHSIASLGELPADVLLDRCPLDFIAYLQSIDEDFDIEDWLDDVRDSIAALDLLVVVPIEMPDRIAVPDYEDRRLRRRVDERLKLLTENAYGFDVETLEVSGNIDERVRQVMRAMKVT
jgi:predicted ATPase